MTKTAEMGMGRSTVRRGFLFGLGLVAAAFIFKRGVSSITGKPFVKLGRGRVRVAGSIRNMRMQTLMGTHEVIKDDAATASARIDYALAAEDVDGNSIAWNYRLIAQLILPEGNLARGVQSVIHNRLLPSDNYVNSLDVVMNGTESDFGGTTYDMTVLLQAAVSDDVGNPVSGQWVTLDSFTHSKAVRLRRPIPPPGEGPALASGAIGSVAVSQASPYGPWGAPR